MSDIDIIRDEKRTEDDKMEKIADILEADEQSVEVVNITDMAGTFSDDDFEKILKHSTIITVGTQYYYKQYSAATVIRYAAAPRLGANRMIIFEYIDIEKSDKSYEVKHEEITVAEETTGEETTGD